MRELLVAGIELRLDTEARLKKADANGVTIGLGHDSSPFRTVFNCTYAALDALGIPLRNRLKKELAEIALIGAAAPDR